MEPSRQVEIQLGHLCTNRCVFCVSAQQNTRGAASVLRAEPILDRIAEARAKGHAKLTLLGGEPTLQPSFMEVVRQAVEMGFEEIVVFTNGVRTARPSFVDEVLATGGRFTWRLSVQGGNREAHERTTRRRGSFARILRTLENLAAREQPITVNTCLVGTNFESVDALPGLLLPFGVSQLHLDMMRPKDAGSRGEAELRETIPRYPDMAPALERMVEGFETRSPGFDVNIGNLPQCMAPAISPWIRHDGETTETVAIDGDDSLSEPWDKYEVKARDKVKLERCRACVFDGRCSGVYETYLGLHGSSDILPVDEEALAAADPKRRLLPLHLASRLAELSAVAWPGGMGPARWSETADDEITVMIEGEQPLAFSLAPPSRVGVAACDLFSLQVRALPGNPRLARDCLKLCFDRLSSGRAVLHPLGDDAVSVPAGALGRRLGRLRRAAPFPGLMWQRTELRRGKVEVGLSGGRGEKVRFWLEQRAGKPSGGYELEQGEASEEVVAGLRAMMAALRSGRGAG